MKDAGTLQWFSRVCIHSAEGASRDSMRVTQGSEISF